MFQLQFVIGLFLGFEFNIMHIVLNAPINAENDLELDYNAADSRLLFDQSDRSMNGADAYSENELANIFINPEEMGPYLEGDIFIPSDLMFKTGSKATKLWPNGVVPVTISPNFTQSQTELIRLALNKLSSKTCLRFPNRTTEADYAHFSEMRDGCFSTVGHKGGKQIINLQSPNCFKKVGTIIHELLHTVGFYHEHARNDRDDNVKIVWENIRKGLNSNFDRSENKIVPSVDLTYDYASVMHYSRSGFAIYKQKPSIVPLFNTTDALKMGQRVGLSPLDIKKVNAKYHCENIKKRKYVKTKKKDTETDVHFAIKAKTFYLEFNFTSNNEKTYFNMIDLYKPNITKSKP